MRPTWCTPTSGRAGWPPFPPRAAATSRWCRRSARSASRTGTSYALKLTDSTTTGNNISVTKTCALATCVDTSAEWISERPSFSIGIVPQAHYNAFKLTSGSVTANGKTTTIGTGPGVNAITMIDATQTYNLNTVSALTGGNSFSTTWKNSY